MDTEAIYRAVCDYGQAKYHCWESDSADHLSEIKRLLKEAEDERAELLRENERLHDLAGGWRPIDSAPKDKTHVALLRMNEDGSTTYGHGYYMPWDGWACWQHYAQKPPTHWMPLPPPPETA